MGNVKLADDLKRPTMNVEQTRVFLEYGHRSTIYRLLDCGDLEGYRVGKLRGVRIYRDSVEAFKRRAMDEGY